MNPPPTYDTTCYECPTCGETIAAGHVHECLTTYDILRHVFATYGVDDPAIPLATVRRKLKEFIETIEQEL